MTKKEIIEKLEAKGTNFDSKAKKADLEKLLNAGSTTEKSDSDQYEGLYFSKGREHSICLFSSVEAAKKALKAKGAHVLRIKKV